MRQRFGGAHEQSNCRRDRQDYSPVNRTLRGANGQGLRLMVGAPVGMLFVAIFLAGRADAAVVGPGYDIEMSRLIPVRDGTLLEAWITKPSNLTMKVPTILTLTQYDIDGGRHGDEAGY